MLQLKGIQKNYLSGDSKVTALKGIDLKFRENEFVAILGPSGCGKTTLLNIIGGLDQYTSGDLIINGRSTKQFRDSDWDSYRNHSIGFVFQSYNLIPHQTVLSNVELALTLSGISKAERRKRAVEVLEKVGLGDQLNKKPNQMSGGQMQRVAIARALINNPDILLADEPTGALDSVTSVQIMEILKEIAKDKLIIMVTHNPELAEQYSSRIIKLLDGKVIDDSAPFEEETAEEVKREKVKKPSMSFFTALSLSFNNLLTKKARTLLTSFAGSIGIIGIALILALSHGIQAYIDKVQQDTLSSYPISIEAENVDMSSLMLSLMGTKSEENSHELDKVYSSSVMYDMINAMNSAETTINNLTAFKEYLENDDSGIKDYISAVQYGYDYGFNVYTKDIEDNIIKSDVTALMQSIMGGSEGMDAYWNSSMVSSFSGMEVWEEMLPGEDGELVSSLVKDEYDVIYGSWPKEYNDVMLVVDSRNEISDYCLYALGLKTSEELQKVMVAAMNEEQIDTVETSWTYEEICEKEFRMIPSADYYQYDSTTKTYKDLTQTDAGLKYLYDNGIDLNISGIVRLKEDSDSALLSGSLCYTSALTEYVVNSTSESSILKEQLENKDIDVFNGLKFPSENDSEISPEQKAEDIKVYIASISNAEKAAVYTEIMSVADEAYVSQTVEAQMAGMTREYIESMMTQSYAQEMGVDEQELKDYAASMDDETLFSYVREMIAESVRAQYAETITQQFGAMTADELAAGMDSLMETSSTDELAVIYDNHMPPTISESTYEENLKLLGYADLDSPSSIRIYADTFEAKDTIADMIEEYNNSASEDDKISYTDYVALMMSSITLVINAISYVLIAFVAISLIVSSIMIGIITYISVLERTKEIGILRSIGASKKDISRVFNAETIIVGFGAGLIGIGVTVLLCIPINIVIRALTGIPEIGASLPVAGGIILVIISMLLTFIAGLIPAKFAARKDPVEALRTE